MLGEAPPPQSVCFYINLVTTWKTFTSFRISWQIIIPIVLLLEISYYRFSLMLSIQITKKNNNLSFLKKKSFHILLLYPLFNYTVPAETCTPTLTDILILMLSKQQLIKHIRKSTSLQKRSGRNHLLPWCLKRTTNFWLGMNRSRQYSRRAGVKADKSLLSHRINNLKNWEPCQHNCKHWDLSVHLENKRKITLL